MTKERLNYLFSVVQNVFSFPIYVFQFRVFRVFRVFRGKNVFYFFLFFVFHLNTNLFPVLYEPDPSARTNDATGKNRLSWVKNSSRHTPCAVFGNARYFQYPSNRDRKYHGTRRGLRILFPATFLHPMGGFVFPRSETA